MKQILWGTDLHYNFPEREYLNALHEKVRESMESVTDGVKDETLALLISGDTSEAHLLKSHLELIRKNINVPIFFVCGNHDYWKKKMSTTRQMITKLTEETDIKWLGAIPYGKLTEQTAVVGHDGWYDALEGDWQNSNFFMQDWAVIPEFHGKTMLEIVDFCRSLAHVGADHVKLGFKKAVEDGFKNIIIVTHVPPYRQASMHKGKPGSDKTVCWYTSQIMGDALYEISAENPDVNVTVLCGHTHSTATVRVLPNLVVHVGHAEYYEPRYRTVAIKE